MTAMEEAMATRESAWTSAWPLGGRATSMAWVETPYGALDDDGPPGSWGVATATSTGGDIGAFA